MLPRRRTRCVYCGARMPGALPGEHSRNPGRDRERRLAARVGCERHLDLPALERAYAAGATCDRIAGSRILALRAAVREAPGV